MKYNIYKECLINEDIYIQTSPLCKLTSTLSKCLSPRPIMYPITDIIANDVTYNDVDCHQEPESTLCIHNSLKLIII